MFTRDKRGQGYMYS